MGAYLHIGFVAKATLTLPNSVSIQELQEELEEYYSVQTFDYVQSDTDEVTLSLKQEVIKSELHDFVEEVFDDYHGEWDEEARKEVLSFILKHSDDSDWLDKIEDADLEVFSVNDYGNNESFTVKNRLIHLQTTIITLGSEGKFFMEDCEKTLSFMETCAQKAYCQYKLGATFRVYVL